MERDTIRRIREAVRSWALEALVAAYGGDAYRLLTDLADRLVASIAYVDRPTVEASSSRFGFTRNGRNERHSISSGPRKSNTSRANPRSLLSAGLPAAPVSRSR